MRKPKLSSAFLAKCITTNLDWDYLVINENAQFEIKLIQNWIVYNDKMVNEWNMEGKFHSGFRALFYGPPGTGKTFTATLLGKKFSKDVYRIALSLVISEYIGETEKNLSKIFDAAEDKNWILFFDEGDALFGKRTPVSNGHVRDTNQEISYLLQLIEDFQGLVIVAFNNESNIDLTFLNRFNSIVPFLKPDAKERLQLWKVYLPPKHGLTEDELLDISIQHKVTGANILNTIHNSAINAFASHRLISYYDIIESLKRELRKHFLIPEFYINDIPLSPPSEIQFSSAIPAFIGYTQKTEDCDGASLLKKPKKILSLKEYEDIFGMADNEENIEVEIIRKTENFRVILKSVKAYFKNGMKASLHIMYYAIRLYFDNGGGPCYIVSIGKSNSEKIIDEIKLQEGLIALAAFDEPNLIVFPEGQGISDGSKYYSLVAQALKQCADLRDRFTIIDIHKQESDTNTTIVNFRGGGLTGTPGFTSNENLSYGAAYYPNLKTINNYTYSEENIDVKIFVDESDPVITKLSDLKTNGDLEGYNSAKDALQKLSPVLPPSSAIAGVYAHSDSTRGVWKAPANVSLNSIDEATVNISYEEQEFMKLDPASGKSVNAIRSFGSKGTLVWGARTLDGNNYEWRYISVRRLAIMVGEYVKKATMPFAFGPNDDNTWIQVRTMLENYLYFLWRQGAFEGVKPDEAFFVKCGLGQTMTTQDILEGILIIEIGMALARPAEFIIIRILNKLNKS